MLKHPSPLRLTIFFLLSGLALTLAQTSQDIYSLKSSKAFADYLFAKGDLKDAADEYARILFMQPSNDSALTKLSMIYRRLNDPAKAEDLFATYRMGQINQSPMLEFEYAATLLFQTDGQTLTEALQKSLHLNEEQKSRFAVEHALLQRKWEEAHEMLKEAPSSKWRDDYINTTGKALAFRPKKPWLAATLSVFLPGSGKIYAKNTKEGITSFLFVAAMGYQSYRAFDKRGSESAAGWIYGGLGLGFYLGNIYGAQQSAKNYNARKWQAIYDEVDNTIYRRY